MREVKDAKVNARVKSWSFSKIVTIMKMISKLFLIDITDKLIICEEVIINQKIKECVKAWIN